MTNGNYTRRGFIDLLKGGAAIAALGAVSVTAGCSTGTEAKPGTTPSVSAPTVPGQESKTPAVEKSPDAGALPTTEQLAELTPDQIVQSIQDYLALAQTPAEYAQRRVDVINMTLSAGTTKAEVDKYMLGANQGADTYLAYIKSRYLTAYESAIEAPGEKNATAGLEWDNSFFAAAHLRAAAGQAAPSEVPYKVVATLGEANVTQGNPATTREAFSEVFTFTLVDNFKESGVNQFFPNSEVPIDMAFKFTTNIVPSEKNGKTVLTSLGISKLRTK